MPTFPQILLLGVNVANLLIGIRVLVKNPRNLVNQSFFIFVLASSTWAAGILFLYITKDFYFDKLALGGGLFMSFGITLFARVFPSGEKVPRYFYLVFIPLVIAILCLPYNLFIRGIVIDSQGFVSPINGPLFPFFISTSIGYTLLAFYYLSRSYIRSSGKSRLQIFYFGAGLAMFMLSILIFDVALPAADIYRFNLLGPAASLFFMFMTSYAIVKHQLMDIRALVQKGFAYSILISLIIGIYVSTLITADYISDSAGWIVEPVSALIIIFISLITIPRFERFFQKATNRFFFKNPYEYSAALEELSIVLNENLDLAVLLPKLFNSLTSILHPEFLEFSHLTSGTHYGLLGKMNESDIERNLHPEIEIAIRINDKILGIFYFGSKRSGEPYTSQDHTLLRTFARQAAVAFEKAELYEELKKHSESLEETVQNRTKSILELQTHQRQLFDDMSHALQTPVTILKSGVEILRNDVVSESSKTLEAMEYSIDDLSRLITKILELARMDSIPKDDHIEKIDLSKLIEDLVEYVEVVCRSKAIQLSKEIESEIFLPGNYKQIEESITNLLSNAVKYTADSEKKEIYVTLHRSGENIELRIKDTGIGIASDKLLTIFDRFYRGGNHRVPGTGNHGLGLAIVKKVIERHGGTVYAESIMGKGTTMVAIFPNALYLRD